MLSPPANNDHNGWQPRAWRPAPRRFRYGVRSPNGVQSLRKPYVESTGVQTGVR